MEIDIQALNFSLTIVQREYVERRLAFALGSDSKHIERITVWLSEITVAEGRSDKRCLIHAALAGDTMIVIENTDPDLFLAVHRAADRAGWKVSRSLGRLKLLASKGHLPGRRWTEDRMRTEYPQRSG